jgi:hypothetical protein
MTPSMLIGEILETVGWEGILLETDGQERFALLPLDDELIDFLIERSPTFRARKRRNDTDFSPTPISARHRFQPDIDFSPLPLIG